MASRLLDGEVSEDYGLLRVDQLSFTYDRTEVLHDVSLRAPAGSLTGILGPNGSGKTTLLRLLGGLLCPSVGRVRLGDDDVGFRPRNALAQHLAMVPQETHLAFEYSVLEIALMGRYPHLRPMELEGPNDLRLARLALAATGTHELEHRPFSTLSGGEKQRVIIASALAQLWPSTGGEVDGISPAEHVLLLDEPTASLDLGYQLEIATTLRALNARFGTTIVVSTHDLNFAASVCDDLLLLREGCVVASGPTEKVLTAANIQTLYDVKVDVYLNPTGGHLTVVPITRATSSGPSA